MILQHRGYTPIHPADLTYTHSLFFGMGTWELESQRAGGERTLGVEESADFLFNLASMTFLIFIPRLLCPLLTSGRNESGLCGDQWTPLKPPFSAASSFIFLSQPFFFFLCISIFLSLVFPSVFPLLPLIFF